jgi:ribose transport system permease protein
VTRHLIMLYVFSAICAGISGFLDLARFDATSIGGHASDNLQAIAACVLGGTSLFGGIGGIAGSVVGSLFPSVLYNGFIQLGTQPFWQGVIVGTILIAAIFFDTVRRSRSRGG